MYIRKRSICSCGVPRTLRWRKSIVHSLSNNIYTDICNVCGTFIGYRVCINYWTNSKMVDVNRYFPTMEAAEKKVIKVRRKWKGPR